MRLEAGPQAKGAMSAQSAVLMVGALQFALVGVASAQAVIAVAERIKLVLATRRRPYFRSN
ncbi:MAG: hypothetical protein U1A72_00330 [Sulfuritalea sp.]|nr:hypothetical protein [Sulfuritalea sp.]